MTNSELIQKLQEMPADGHVMVEIRTEDTNFAVKLDEVLGFGPSTVLLSGTWSA